uniref:RING-type domain-containing protein n=1 Tax=Cairina moschata TaxID=8855 RepID=A0A8C3GH22_CAIMO
MDRRSETRHPHVSIIPSLNCQDGHACQHSGEQKRLELNNVQEETSSRSRPLVQPRSCLWDEILLKNTATGEPVCQTNLSQILETSTLPVSLASCEVEGNQITGNIQNPDKNSEHITKHASGESNDLNGNNGIAFVNIDSYEPDSSDGEDDDGQDQPCLGREGAGVFQEAVDDIVSELGKGIEAFTDLESQLFTPSRRISRECCKEVRPVPLTRYLSIDSDMNHSNNKTLKKSHAEDQAIPKSNLIGDSRETQQINPVDTEICTPVTTYNELNLSDDEAEQGNPPELVVRPKIRKQNPTSRLERETHLSDDDEESESTSNRGSETAKIQQGYDKRTWRNDKEELTFTTFLKSKEYTDSEKDTSTDLTRNGVERNEELCNISWDVPEYYNKHLLQPLEDEDSSECSGGEQSASGPFRFAAAAAKSSSDESSGTLPGREECEPEEPSADIEVYIGSGLGGRELPPLEEVEFPCLQYPEESSSDEENHLVSEFVHPGLFILDGNNNLEDDSSVSEDLDVEWRLLDELNEGLGVAQAISSEDPQFIAYVALEERLTQDMENAVAYLESLAIGDQQAHPAASKECIDRLPQISITDDCNAVGQDQCYCTICFSEYVKDEIVTELPCHHLFHKLCVTLWLQKSGTCPICRHVLAPKHP